MKRGINMGSGQRPFKDTPEIQWTNVDKLDRPDMPPPHIVADGSDLKGILQDNFFDYYVLHHVLEHFGCGEGAALIQEAYRVLKPDGSLIVCVPDMAKLNHGWFTGKIDIQIYMTNVYGAYMGQEEDRHKWGYSGWSLAKFLEECSKWSRIDYFDFRTIPGADIAQDWWILGMEAIK